ncbi:hypothetical protein SAMN02745751_03619 [Dethiosulfatibacter aminovorans DSM 17477]|uniref:Uncharacterized protein n=1 Tax=Dethiosulfatibacter aminovorans DSM 17477 TaxID=1121476 RepID=A0A1M6MX78_9FIRM|nr:hypothetical protein [Dethiosulfatibacter aminovorans]SHJ88022.1 hypothetical protein SAMN02745751_03619 [Dethiosulfatibacter aminovorans DSM 17477]
MQICKVCGSDILEKTSSTGLRVFLCIVLMFLPYGLLYCWLPLIREHTYICTNCGTESKASEIETIDSREMESRNHDYGKMVEEAEGLIDKWIMTDSNELCKLIYLKGQLFVVGVDSESAITYRMLKYKAEENLIVVDSRVGTKHQIYRTLVSGKGYNITDYGKTVMPLEEQGLIESGDYEHIVSTLAGKYSLIEGMDIERIA